MSAVFVTATGTDIGKTFVAAGLIRHWRTAGRSVDGLKPVATGFDPRTMTESDSGVLLAALGRPVTLPEVERVSPWRFAAPLSPDMAARHEGRALDFAALVERTCNVAGSTKELLLIEGIGGVMVPLDQRHTVLDWMAELGIPILLVTGSYLGSLSHTLTALDAVHARKLAVAALVINETAHSSVSLTDTVETLSRFVAPVPIVTLSRAPADNTQGFSEIATLVDAACKAGGR